MKENTGAVNAQVPVDVASFLLNEKRSEIQKLETRLKVNIVLVPNPHLETPHYRVQRLKHEELNQMEHMPASYELIEQPEPTVAAEAVEPRRERQEAAVKGITPAQPAPTVPERERPAPTAERAVAAAAPAEPRGEPRKGFFQRILGLLKSQKPIEQPAANEPEIAPAPLQPVRQTPPQERHAHEGRRPERHAHERREGRRDERREGRRDEARRNGRRGEPRLRHDAGRHGTEPQPPRTPPQGEQTPGAQPQTSPPVQTAPVPSQPAQAEGERRRRRGRRGRGRGERATAEPSPGQAPAESAERQRIIEEQRQESLLRERLAADVEGTHAPKSPETAPTAPSAEAPPSEPPRAAEPITPPFTAADAKAMLASAGLEMVETDASKIQPIAPESGEVKLGRPRRQRPRPPEQETELIQVETRIP